MRKLTHRRCLLGMLTLGVAAMATGQQGNPPAPQMPGNPHLELQPVDPGVGDVSPLGLSLRDQHTDLRVPTGFEGIYRLAGLDDMLIRANGGLYAVFPQSVYDADDGAVVPAGTVYMIGSHSLTGLPGIMPAFVSPQGPMRSGELAVHAAPNAGEMSGSNAARLPQVAPINFATGPVRKQLGIDLRIIDQPQILPPGSNRGVPFNGLSGSTAAPADETWPEIISDQGYRTDRLRELMQRAMKAE